MAGRSRERIGSRIANAECDPETRRCQLVLRSTHTLDDRIVPVFQWLFRNISHLSNLPRPKDSWVFWGSALGLIEEAVEFAAGRIEGALLLFRAVVDQWASVGPNHIMNKFLGRDLS